MEKDKNFVHQFSTWSFFRGNAIFLYIFLLFATFSLASGCSSSSGQEKIWAQHVAYMRAVESCRKNEPNFYVFHFFFPKLPIVHLYATCRAQTSSRPELLVHTAIKRKVAKWCIICTQFCTSIPWNMQILREFLNSYLCTKFCIWNQQGMN